MYDCFIRFNPKPKINDTIPNGWSLQVQKQLSKANGKLLKNNVILNILTLNALKKS